MPHALTVLFVTGDVRIVLWEDTHSVTEHPQPVPAYVDFEPALGFADWKVEMLSLVV